MSIREKSAPQGYDVCWKLESEEKGEIKIFSLML